ncbi:S41 family peptidase [Sphingobacterium spiritivorum]|uniref:Peptidase, S41 family n=1 Tax=Sphingobacterium spiritivorum ATCC 33861 TaxID=525373 RepID=D7VGS2_SPHSI|nr:S41 family peptidase [Sphingobacterium spiritivorum]EFK59274.1 peptidase, S41 family [Sphingobacterium spiritivorum ATCC 33861]QQT34030.1 PDZ domain-containing protein [Sphingobacterium spiritivorum]WQD34855.1 S41 family peptidase [Sphingobacterium spiritivorum]SUI98578.1 Predicted protease with the C-terminal PDZ domain [Sphingobacterium spiritivorum]
MKRLFPVLLILLLFTSVYSCKKSDNPDNKNDTEEDMIKDSVFYYTKVLSLWEGSMPPGNVNTLDDKGVVRSYTKKYATGEEVLKYMMSLTPVVNGSPVDRYSFIDRQGTISGEIEEGVSTSYGMYVFYLQTSSSGDNADLYVRMVDKNSPAYQAGIRRGDRILSINGQTNIDYKTQQAQSFKLINDALNSKSMTIKFVSQTSVTTEKQIVSSLYNFDPILASKVIEQNGKKIGYLAFSSFVAIYNNRIPTAMLSSFENIFSQFEGQNISELIVDLRYNGGGSVETAEYLANRIVPASATGKRMYSYKLNRNLQAWGWAKEGGEFGPVNYAKKGTLNLNKVYFLVTESTASASELLINSLKPYFKDNQKMIGTYGADSRGNRVVENTYGKPVGFFRTSIPNTDVDLYATSFQTINADNYGDYFAGLTPDGSTYEDYFKDFGDPQEGMIAEALYYSLNGSWLSSTSKTALASVNKLRNEKYISRHRIDTRAHANGMYKFQTRRSK